MPPVCDLAVPPSCRDKLRARLRLQLGAKIAGPDRAELIARVASLETAAASSPLSATPAAAEASHAQRRIRDSKTISPPPAKASAALDA